MNYLINRRVDIFEDEDGNTYKEVTSMVSSIILCL